MEHDIPFGNSNRENGTTFLDFPLFLGIFQWDEPTKRVPFTAEPEIPEILTKWKAPKVSEEQVFPNSRVKLEKFRPTVVHLVPICPSPKTFYNGLIQQYGSNAWVEFTCSNAALNLSDTAHVRLRHKVNEAVICKTVNPSTLLSIKVYLLPFLGSV